MVVSADLAQTSGRKHSADVFPAHGAGTEITTAAICDAIFASTIASSHQRRTERRMIALRSSLRKVRTCTNEYPTRLGWSDRALNRHSDCSSIATQVALMLAILTAALSVLR